MSSPRYFALASVLVLTLGTRAQTSKGQPMPVPELPHATKNACPFEYCVYREWKARAELPVFDTWREPRKRIGTLPKGEPVTALGGMVVTYRAGVIHLDRDVPEGNLRRGDTILTYADRGEGFSEAWVNGSFYEELDVTFTKLPDGTGCGNGYCAATYLDLGKKTWWAELKLQSGKTVWVDMDGLPFDGVDRSAGDRPVR